MDVNKMIMRFGLQLRDTDKIAATVRKPTAAEAKELIDSKQAILTELKKRKAAIEAEKAEEKLLFENQKASKIKISASYKDGEYLQGWQVCGDIGKELENIGVAQWIEAWGYLINENFIERVGTEFTIQQAVDFMKPVVEKKEREKQEKEERRQKAFQQAKETNKSVEIYRFITDCDGSVQECSTDIVIGYVMPDGSIKNKRVHTY